MVEIALITGAYSYLIFAIGLLGLLKPPILIGSGVVYFATIAYFVSRHRFTLTTYFCRDFVNTKRLTYLLLTLFVAQIVINLIGVFGPELGFDALWYHLTIPKIYLNQERISFLPGNLLYYSAMPKLIEMLYLVGLAIVSDGTLAKLTHFLFGIGTTITLYLFCRRSLKRDFALLAVLIFYTSLIVGWQSITAYVDLARTFFELLALYVLVLWWDKTKSRLLLVESALLFGLTISTKLLALSSLPLFLCILLIQPGVTIKTRFINCLLFIGTALFTVTPWLIFSLLATGNPVYPIFSGILDATHTLNLNPVYFLRDIGLLLIAPADLISPLFLLFLPFVLFLKPRVGKIPYKALLLIAFICWYLLPRTGGGRFFLPYLPLFSFLIAQAIAASTSIRKLAIFVCLLVFIGNLAYRFTANLRYLPVLLGTQSRQSFLLTKLTFTDGDFFDIDNRIHDLVGKNSVYIVGGHNLAYADFIYFHETFAPKNTYFPYVLTLAAEPPATLQLLPIYHQPKTNATLYLNRTP